MLRIFDFSFTLDKFPLITSGLSAETTFKKAVYFEKPQE